MLKFLDLGLTPSAPPVGYVGIYCNAGVLYWIDDVGAVSSIASGLGDLKADGTVPLTADYDVGAFKVTALQLESDIATGIGAPLIVASTDQVTNLNAQFVQGKGVLDEDTLVSDSDTAIPTQQSVKAYVDGKASDYATATQGSTADSALQPADVLPAIYNNQTGTTYTIQASDAGKIITFNNAASIAVTLPDTLDTNFQCTIIQIGAGVPTITPNTDTINGAGSGVAPSDQWKALYLSQFADTEWLAIL